MKTSATSRFLYYSLAISCIFALMAMSSAQAEENHNGTIAFLPFEINASKDLYYLRDGVRDMLASRLAAHSGLEVVDKVKTDNAVQAIGKKKTLNALRSFGTQLGADYLVTGSITSIGATVSIDTKVIETKGDDPAQSFFVTAASMDQVIPAVDQLAKNINKRAFASKSEASSSQAETKVENSAIFPLETAHPDRAFIASAPVAAPTPTIASEKAKNTKQASPTTMTDMPSGFTKSQNFKMELMGMDVGDVDGDGIDEIVLADTSEIKVFKQNSDKLNLFFRIPVISRATIHAVNLADLNNNGRMEIYVSTAEINEARSFAVEWQHDKFDYLFKGVRWHVRPLNVEGKGTILAGQRTAVEQPFLAGIYRLLLNGDNIEKEEKLDIPAQVNLFDFSLADLDGDGQQEIIAIDQFDRLKVMRADGSVIWKSEAHFGGTRRYIGGKNTLTDTKPGFDTEESIDQDRIYLPSRIVTWDINKDGRPEIIVNKNSENSSRVMANLRKYPSGTLQALSWNGLGLVTTWESEKIDGGITEYQLRSSDGHFRIYVGIVLNGDWLSSASRAETTVVVLPLGDKNK